MTRQSRVSTADQARVHNLWHYILWLLICGSLSGAGSAANAMSAVRLDDGVGNVVLTDKFEAFVDQGGQLTLTDVQGPTYADRFSVTKNGRIAAQRSDAIWLRIALRNTAADPRHWWLDTGMLWIKSMDLYAPDAAGTRTGTGQTVGRHGRWRPAGPGTGLAAVVRQSQQQWPEPRHDEPE